MLHRASAKDRWQSHASWKGQLTIVRLRYRGCDRSPSRTRWRRRVQQRPSLSQVSTTPTGRTDCLGVSNSTSTASPEVFSASSPAMDRSLLLCSWWSSLTRETVGHGLLARSRKGAGNRMDEWMKFYIRRKKTNNKTCTQVCRVRSARYTQ